MIGIHEAYYRKRLNELADRYARFGWDGDTPVELPEYRDELADLEAHIDELAERELSEQ
jgi:hypothetical protein